MEGMAHAAQRQFELAISTAWHTAVFALNGYSGKLKDLSEYTGRPNEQRREDSNRLSYAQGIAFFTRLRERGFNVRIERAVH
jgi:hypothetical protein